MPKLTKQELESLDEFSNELFDFLYQDLNLSEEIADKIAIEIINLIQNKVENTLY